MKKVIALIGSRAGNQSRTKELCSKFIASLQEAFQEEFKAELLTADIWNINNCLSCSSCFQNGFCPQDKLDHIGEIKEKLLEADIIILGSPVFAGNVSGDTKTLIDRLSLWLHIMPLIGKVGIPLCTASNNHTDKVIDYLREILEDYGASIPTDVRAFLHSGDVLMKDEEKLQEYLKKQAEVTFLWCQQRLVFSKIQETRFYIQSRKFEKHNRFKDEYPELSENMNEARLWREMGYGQCNSIYEALQIKQSERATKIV